MNSESLPLLQVRPLLPLEGPLLFPPAQILAFEAQANASSAGKVTWCPTAHASSSATHSSARPPGPPSTLSVDATRFPGTCSSHHAPERQVGRWYISLPTVRPGTEWRFYVPTACSPSLHPSHSFLVTTLPQRLELPEGGVLTSFWGSQRHENVMMQKIYQLLPLHKAMRF